MSGKKEKLYSELLERLVNAHHSRFFFEACWFAYAIFEDRSRSIVRNSGDGKGEGGSISDKLLLILERYDATVSKVKDGKPVRDKKSGKKEKVRKWPNLSTFDRRLIEETLSWTKERNELMHDLAAGSINLADADKRIMRLAERAIPLTREVCSAARRLKKRNLKRKL